MQGVRSGCGIGMQSRDARSAITRLRCSISVQNAHSGSPFGFRTHSIPHLDLKHTPPTFTAPKSHHTPRLRTQFALHLLLPAPNRHFPYSHTHPKRTSFLPISTQKCTALPGSSTWGCGRILDMLNPHNQGVFCALGLCHRPYGHLLEMPLIFLCNTTLYRH